jgi:hypothetical protein
MACCNLKDLLNLVDISLFKNIDGFLISFAVPRHFGSDPDPRIHTSNRFGSGSGPAIFVSDFQDGYTIFFAY